jgi:hypothetical protein
LNDYLWLSLILGTAALDTGNLPNWAGCSTCVDMRSRLRPEQIDYTVGQCYSELTASTPLSGNMTLRDAGQRMREDLVRRRNRLEDFVGLKFLDEEFSGPTFPGIGLEVTNMGQINIRPPATDAWASLVSSGEEDGYCLTAMAFSVVGPAKNDLVVRLRYGVNQLGADEAYDVARVVDHFLRNVSLDRKVQDAFDEVKAFLKGL